MDKLKNMYKNYFSIGPKAVLVVMLSLMVVTAGVQAAQKTIVVSIDGKETKIVTFRKTFKDVLSDNSIVLGPKDKITPSIDTKLKKNDRIDIKKAVNVTVAVDGQEKKILTTEDTVYKMFNDEGIIVKDTDRVVPSRNIQISDGLNVVVTRIESKIISESVDLDFSTVVKNDDEAITGSKKVLQEGEKGERVITTEFVYEDGKEVERTVVNDVVTKKPVQRIVSVGTLAVLNLSRGGQVAYKNSIKMKATAYTSNFASTGKSPGDKGFGRTATGTIAKRNPDGYSSIAVDPRVIPLGTKLYIEGYGYGIAEDTGGAIKGNIIDVYLNSEYECRQWGVRTVNVYIVK